MRFFGTLGGGGSKGKAPPDDVDDVFAALDEEPLSQFKRGATLAVVVAAIGESLFLPGMEIENV